MVTSEALLDFHERAHSNLKALIDHCRQLTPEELDRELPGFGYPSVRLQLHHEIGAQRYWIGVLQGRIEADDNAPDFPTLNSLEAYRQEVYSATEEYIRTASREELNTARRMMTWGNKEQLLTPVHVFMRTLTHLYHHQGQMTAMCRIMGHPAHGLDYPHG